MTVNYFIKCPICGAIIRMRSPAGYLYRSIVRIHCGNCNTLLTGEFISDNKNIKAYFLPLNCEEITRPDGYDFECQASGELLTTKIIKVDAKTASNMPHSLSPAMNALMSIQHNDFEYFINFISHLEYIDKNWDIERVLYDLYLNKHYDLISKKYSTGAQQSGYELNSDYDVMRYVYFNYFNNYGGIFKNDLGKQLNEINYQFYHLKKEKLLEFIKYITETASLDDLEKRLFDISDKFVNIPKYIIPAISVLFYKDQSLINRDTQGMSTCTFDDIKSFYLDTFECLASLSYIVKGLDNICYRGHYNLFDGTPRDMDEFKDQSNGSKIKFLNDNEKFSALFSLSSTNNQLRNAIGHNNYTYHPAEQLIEYIPNSKQPQTKKIYLLDVALECLKQMKSSMTLVFYIFELKRYSQINQRLPLHELFLQ